MTPVLNKISDCKVKLDITVTKDEFDGAYNDILKNVQRNIRMPGFRPGKVPVGLIKKQYGPSLKYEAIEEITKKSLAEYIKENKLNILGTPAMTDLKENEDGSHSFTVEFEVLPDFDLKDYKSLEIYEPVHRVTDDEIEREIEFQLKKWGKREEVEVVTSDSIVTFDGYPIDPETKAILKGEKPYIDVEFDLSDKENSPELKETLININARVGDVIDEYVVNGKKQPSPEKMIIKKIEKVIPCEKNDEFAKLATNGRFDNVEDFRQEVGFQIQKIWDDKAKQFMEEQVLTKVVEIHNDFELPEVLTERARELIVDSMKKQNRDVNFSDPKVQQNIDISADKIIRAEIVRNKIIEKEELRLEDFDFENFVDDFFAKNGEHFGAAFSKEAMLSRVKSDEQFANELLQKKLVDFLMDYAKTNEIDFEEFIKIKTQEEEASKNKTEANKNDELPDKQVKADKDVKEKKDATVSKKEAKKDNDATVKEKKAKKDDDATVEKDATVVEKAENEVKDEGKAKAKAPRKSKKSS